MSTGPRLIAVRVSRARSGSALRAVWAAGHAALMIDPAAPTGAVRALLDRLRPHGVWDLVSDAAAPLPAPTARTAATPGLPDDAALVVTTSGSTGTPQGVVLTHAALSAATDASCRALALEAGDRLALALPTHHVAGISVWLRAWWTDTDPVVLAGDDARSPSTAIDAGVRLVSLVPTQLRRWLAADNVEAARWPTVLLGGAAAPDDLLRDARARGVEVVTSYGMSETVGGCVYDGSPLPGVEVDVDDAGRIGLRGPMLAAGIWDGVRTTALTLDQAGWWRTRDRGRWVDGRLEVLGRVDDVVISGGENVPLPAVREALTTHPAVADVAVIGRDDPQWGTRVVAVVVPDGPEPPTLERLRDHVAATLPRTWGPRALVLVDALPRDDMGKVPRAALERLLEREAAQER